MTAPDPLPAAESPLFVVAVAALILHRGRVLAMRRSRHKDAGAGLWETLSGRLAPDEDPLTAVHREVAEECGLAVDVDPRPFTAYTARRLALPMTVIVYRARYLGGEVVLSDEHDAFAWLTPAEFAIRSPLTRLVEAVRAAASATHPPRDDPGR